MRKNTPKRIDPNNFDIRDFLNEDNDLSIFEECLIDSIKDWQESGKDPRKNLELLKEYATELLANALQPIPCWERVKASPFLFANGIHHTPIGDVLIHNGYFVKIKDLVEGLPRTLDD